MRKSTKFSDIDKLKQIVKQSRSFSEVARRLGYKSRSDGQIPGGTHRFLKQKLIQLDIDINHLKGQGWARGLTRENDASLDQRANRKERVWDEVFCEGSIVGNPVLIRRLIRSGRKKYKCEICGIHDWCGLPLRLQLDHINGNNLDNREDNLRLLCPNCHAQTGNHSLGHTRRPQQKNEVVWWQKLSQPNSVASSLHVERVRQKKKEAARKGSQKSGFSRRKVIRPLKSVLELQVDQFGYCHTGRLYGVSDNCIRKWLK
jgi:5-methylcytosine-specific restriction endonuclease McrA